MKTISFIALSIFLGLTIYGTGPFCKVDGYGNMAQCYYYSLDACLKSIYGNQFCIMRP